MRNKSISNLHQSKQGHVYIASNIGSFGPDIFKIGVTRRLNPIDRVHELNTCSVPFPFDVHAFIYSDDVFKLEKTIHKALHDKSVNRINSRKEFFKISIKEIEIILSTLNISFDFYGGYEASEYKKSMDKT